MSCERVGRIRVNRLLLRLDDPQIRALMASIIVLDAWNADPRTIEYTALCEAFDPISEIEVIPQYCPVFGHTDAGVIVTFSRLGQSNADTLRPG